MIPFGGRSFNVGATGQFKGIPGRGLNYGRTRNPLFPKS